MIGNAPAPTRTQRLRTWISRETTGGALLIGAAFLALLWANSPWREAYQTLSDTVVGPAAIGPLPVHLDLPLDTWAADGLLAIFFFVVGVELKQEFVAGSLRNPKEAGVPMIAAVGGMAVPALIYVGTLLVLDEPGALRGWAIPTATDIAFAVGVLAIFGRGLPTAIRTFLLTLAVVDDLLAIIVIAIFYTSEIHWLSLLGALACVALFAWHVRSRRPRWFVLLPLAVVAWTCMHASGVHATISGVLLGFTVPALAMHGEATSRTAQYEHRVKPVSSGFALPVFAFFAAGVSLVDGDGPGAVIGQPVVAAIAAGLVLGKLVGVLGTTALITRITPLRLPAGIGVRDLLPVGFLAGIGFTVSLLISELSFGDSEHTDGAKIAILGASVLAAILGGISLRWDARRARTADMNLDGISDDVHDYIGDPKDRESH
ncbi:sodium/proton antiporter (NhaA family) [Promicromonospora sp. AC04]|uniref:Na+/H+ antiporter NhaA n=1 Tax=Promicromonospora sp. AC04 TaxID=2135723 RepID=UPI000D39AC26|nr:Na+/H+ antiporter NhaA [Promicromonospora sp. AC04]PUB29657.1 sodium/proton antiporter (NhaA family) [Promicromonospora sp. AC04]